MTQVDVDKLSNELKNKIHSSLYNHLTNFIPFEQRGELGMEINRIIDELIDKHTVDEPAPKSKEPFCDCDVCVCGHPNCDHQGRIGDEYAYCLVCSCKGFEEKDTIRATTVEEVK